MNQQLLTITKETISDLTIRPFNPIDEEYRTLLAIWNTVWPELETALEEYKYQDERRDPTHYFQRLVVEKNGRIVAYGVYCETWWSKNPPKYHINLAVLPQFQKQGIGTAYYNHVMNILAQRPDFNLLTAETREDQADSIRFLTNRGFEQVMRFPISYLDVHACDTSKYDGLLEKVNASGIQLQSVATLRKSDPDWLHKLWEMECEIEKDIPYPDPITPTPFKQFKKIVGNPNFLPEAFLVAVDNGRFVSTSALWSSKASDTKLFTGLTGTLRSHRRRSLATALKVMNIRYAQAKGAEIIETDNEENNPMYQINVQLGFKPQPAMLDFHKKIQPG
ncbi:MAG: GNAT family N-acetyltransferase [Chloroflexi bacterium]|nr:GNAT family N-acetyltransferase [Chloroflexota bacterium]